MAPKKKSVTTEAQSSEEKPKSSTKKAASSSSEGAKTETQSSEKPKGAKKPASVSNEGAKTETQSSAKPKSGKKPTSGSSEGLEVPTRTLRPRNPAPPPTEPPAKPKKSPKRKANNDTAKNTNGLTEKKAPVKPKKRKPNKNAKEEQEDVSSTNNEEEDETPTTEDTDKSFEATSIYDFKAMNIQGKEVPLDQYKGHVCIIVNVASRCGHTASNYKELVELHENYSEAKGLKILAFPCNQFGKQEPGDNAKICEFAKKKKVEFDMFEKIEVNGENANPLWKYLTNQIEGPQGSNIDWNFTKFLIDKEGKVVGRFKPTVKPLALVPELEKLW